MNLKDHHHRLIELAQKWRTGVITDKETCEMETWYQAMAGKSLGSPTGLSVESLEKYLHEMICKNDKPELPEGFNLSDLLRKTKQKGTSSK